MTVTTSRRCLFAACLLLALAGCGLKGGLYLPPPETENPAAETTESEEDAQQATPDG